ncbi:MAG: hypothetical protein ABI338_08450 [Gemmatimonadaceae bacterium]
MISPFYIFVDGAPVLAHAGQTILDAIAAWRPEVGASLVDKSRLLADSRGLPADPTGSAFAGAIFRVVTNRQAGAAYETSHD